MWLDVGTRLFIFAGLLLKFSPILADKIYDVKNSWDTGFQGEINIPIKETTTEGWKLEVRFHKRIQSFEIWVGKFENAEQGDSGSTFYYKNEDYNKVLEGGSTLKVEFNGAFVGKTGPKVPPVTIKFQYKTIYSDYYTPASGTVQQSTTDIVFVLNSLTRGTSSRSLEHNATPSTYPSSPINNVTPVSPSLTRSQGETSEEINNRNNQRTENFNSKNNKNSGDSNVPDSSTNQDNSMDYDEDAGSGDQPLTTPSPGKRPARRTEYPYIRLIQKSLLFYEAQRSGPLPPDNRITWRGDSAMQDRGGDGEDLTGGYYDAGDHMKFGFPMAFSMTTLAWGVIEYWEAYQQAGELENALKAIKWGVDFILKSYVRRYQFYGQVGYGKKDHEYWGRPEDMTMERPAFKITAKKPGSDLAGESSAALSAASIAFERSATRPYATAGYLRKIRRTAEQLYDFAVKFPGLYHEAIQDAERYYKSTSFEDEIVWSATWLYRATGKAKYRIEAEGKYQNRGMFKFPPNFLFSWDDKTVGTQVLLSQVTGGAKREAYLARAQAYCQEMRNNRKRYTPKGLLFMDEWSPLRYSANIAFICLLTSDQGGDSRENFLFAKKQIHYILGDTGRSYVVGFGRRYPKFPHHRASSCIDRSCGWGQLYSKEPNPNILQGALVGGPNNKDVFEDNRENFKSSEVTLDHNSCFQGAVAGLLQRSLIGVKIPNNRTQEPWYGDFIAHTSTIRPTTTSSGCSGRVLFQANQALFFNLVFLRLLRNYL